MFTNQDVGYHTPANVAQDWAETSFFYFYVPEARVMASVYFVARAGVGVMMSDIQIMGELSMHPLDSWYVDTQQHQRLPPRFDKFSLSSGLSFEARSIREYRIDYVGINDTEIHVDVRGVMEPYDINDPSMDPMAVADPHANPDSTGFGTAYSAHFDMACRVTGTLRVRGRKFAVDCVAQMDHSWGKRAEREMKPMLWMNAHFGEDYVVHAICGYDPLAAPAEQYVFRHGYALVDGKVRGAVNCKLLAYHMNRFALGYEWELTDIDGRVHKLFGSPAAMQIWAPYSNVWVPNVFIRWQCGDRVGWGNSAENNPLTVYAGGRLAHRGS
jgi:hypothetical protein